MWWPMLPILLNWLLWLTARMLSSVPTIPAGRIHASMRKRWRTIRRLSREQKQAGVRRLLIVGGAGTLFVKPGVRLVDTGTLPESWLPGVKSLGEFYLNTLMKEQDIDWIFFSPAGNLGNLQPGTRTGKYRLGKDDLLVDEKGESFISVEDYAVAMIDELEQENHHKERFTAAY